MLSLKILLSIVILSSFLVVHTYAQQADSKFNLRISSNPNIIYLDGGGFYDDGTSVTLEAPATWRDYKFEGWQINGRWSFENPLTILMNKDQTVEAFYTKTTLGQIIIDAIPRITDITVDGKIYLPTELPLSFDWAEGSEHSVAISDLVKQTSDTRYKFDSWKDLSKETFRTIKVGANEKEFIAIYKLQHYFRPISEIGTVLGGGWQDEGSTTNFELESDVVIDKKNENIRYIFDSWDTGDYQNSPTNIIDVDEPTTVKATWIEQYKLELHSNVDEYTPLGTGWYTKDRQVALIAEEFIESTNSDIKYSFDKWVSKGPNPVIIPNAQLPTTTVTMAEPYIIEAQYKNSYKVNVWTPYSSAIGAGFYPQGQVAEIKISQPEVIVQPNKVKMVFDGWNAHGARIMDFSETANSASENGEVLGVQNLLVFVDQPINVTANWKSQYYLDVQSSEGKVEGAGWYDLGRLVPISAKISSAPVGMWSTIVFDKWVGDYEGDSPNGRVLVNKPKTVIAEWKEDRTPAVINSIILAAIGAVGFVIYNKTRNGKTAMISKKNYPGIESGGFDKFFKTRSSDSPQQSSTIVKKPNRVSSILNWLLGRED